MIYSSYKDCCKYQFLSCFCYEKYKVSTKYYLNVVTTQSEEHATIEWE